MSKIIVNSVFGQVVAKPLETVDIHDIPASIEIQTVTADNKEESESASDSC